MSSSSPSQYLLDAVAQSLFAATRHAPGETAPAAILWPDADGQWQSLVPQLRTLIPDMLVFGSYAPSLRQGPAIWLRCVIERALPEVELSERSLPVIYLPGISRQTLRAVEECPEALLPLVELQYRGTVWCQRNGKDWTVEAFLVSEDSGMALEIARDNQTRRAMLGALPQLSVTPLSRLRGKRLEAEDFDRLIIEDTPRNLLEWMNDPRGVKEKWDDERWSAYRSRCRAEYSFDPQDDGELVAAQHLGLREGAWSGVWKRFAEAPALYPSLPDLLRKAKPQVFIYEKETWPDENNDSEEALRTALNRLGGCNATDAREQVLKLEEEHAERRQWVWAKLGMSPLAKALGHLKSLATHTAVGLGGDSPRAMADLYAHGAYLADDAVLRALAEVKSAADTAAVSLAVRAMYLPWLQEAAEHFQKLVATAPLPSRGQDEDALVEAEPGTCVLFVDGLRFDIGERLAGLAQDRKLRVTHRRRWAAVPAVTGTAKPAVSPVAEKIVGRVLGEAFVPEIADGAQSVTAANFRKLMDMSGYQYVSSPEVGHPEKSDARAWTEFGELDRLGHDLQAKLANHTDDQLELLVERIEALLQAGWRMIRVVTDHGWLLVPGGLPAISLPKYLTESRWSRCATIKPGAQVTVPTAGWYWNPSEVFAFGPGISCFGNGYEYAHGGLSIQECVIPDLSFTSDAAELEVTATIVSLQWHGMRCRVTIEPAGTPVTADIRTKVGDAAFSITTPRRADAEGKAGLLIEDDSLQGTMVSVVLLDVSGRVVAKQATTVGGEE